MAEIRPTDQDIQEFLEQNRDAVYEMFECRNCGDYCHPPLQKCNLNHLICTYCFNNKEELCEICGSHNSEPSSLILERIHDFLEFQCKYTPKGCPSSGKWCEILIHQEECPHFVTPCPDHDCGWEGKVSELFTHYQESHPNKIILAEEFCKWVSEISLEECSILIRNFIEWSNRVFLLIVIISPLRKSVKFIATNFGPFKDVEEFDILVEFLLEDGSKWMAQPVFYKSPLEIKEGDEIIFTDVECHEINNFRVSGNPNLAYEMMITIGRKTD